MQSIKTPIRVLAAMALLLSTRFVYADGLSDLKTALSKLNGQTPLKAMVEVKTWNRQGEGKELEESSGNASVTMEESTHGMQILYSKEMLMKLEAEERAKEKDPKAKTPTLAASGDVNSSSLRPLMSAAGTLQRSIDKAVFKSEKNDSFNGKPARVLSFELSIDKLNERDRKYLKKLEGGLDVWIAADGTPLASRYTQMIHGRAFVVISFDMKNEEETVFGVSGDHLLVMRKESKNSGSGMGEKGESKTVKTLQVL
jgi:hypothetical protein